MPEPQPPNPFDLQKIMEGDFVVAYFQPIVSVSRQAILGYEGLSRALDPQDLKTINPLLLFDKADVVGLTRELDRLCRKKILDYYLAVDKAHPDYFLSLNFDAAAINWEMVSSGKLIEQVTALGLRPSNIVLEIIEANFKDIKLLQKFIEVHKTHGFLIALDDMGAGRSNLNRIALLKPDILKIDKALVRDISKDFHQQEVFKSLVKVAREMGTLLIAQGVENEEEALAILEMGVDLMQGFYFAKPMPFQQLDQPDVEAKLPLLSNRLREKTLEKLKIKIFDEEKYQQMTQEITETLSKVSSESFEQKLLEVISSFPLVEYVFVLNEQGRQVSGAIFGPAEEFSKKRSIFKPPSMGSDHHGNDYYSRLQAIKDSQSVFVREPSLSLATGNLCVTCTRFFKDAQGIPFILCAVINTEYLKPISA